MKYFAAGVVVGVAAVFGVIVVIYWPEIAGERLAYAWNQWRDKSS